MICEGGIMEQCIIERSVIGIRSKISAGVRLKNVIMMGADVYQTLDEIEENQKAHSPIIGIGENTVIENAIIDKNARIGKNVKLVNEKKIKEGIFDNFEVHDGIIVVYKNANIKPGTTF